MFDRPRGGERAILVGVGIGHPVDPNDTAEFKALAASAGTTSLGTVLDGVAVCAKSLRMAHKSSVVSRVVLFMVGNHHFIF